MSVLEDAVDADGHTLLLDVAVDGLRNGGYLIVEEEVVQFVHYWDDDMTRLFVDRGVLTSVRSAHDEGATVQAYVSPLVTVESTP